MPISIEEALLTVIQYAAQKHEDAKSLINRLKERMDHSGSTGFVFLGLLFEKRFDVYSRCGEC
jgi:hypothetical protein